MENRKLINDRIVSWVRETVENTYADDIHLVVMYGSHINGTAGKLSDVDFYFVPRTQRGYDLARTFLLAGVGYDLYPKTWDQLEEIAALENPMGPLLGDVEFLYCASAEDRQRFEALQTKLKNNLADSELTVRIARERCLEAARICARLDTSVTESAIRKNAGHAVMVLADAIAAARGTYFHKGLKMQYQDLLALSPAVPGHIIAHYRAVAEAGSPEEARLQAKAMLDGVCAWLNFTFPTPKEVYREEPVAPTVDAPMLAGLYEEISSTFNKIYACCESGNHILAYLSAVCLQYELDWARSAGCPVWGLLDGYDHRDLPRLAARARDIERQLKNLIKDNGGILREYADFDSFAAAMQNG